MDRRLPSRAPPGGLWRSWRSLFTGCRDPQDAPAHRSGDRSRGEPWPEPQSRPWGLIGIQFAAQFLQLAHGQTFPSIRVTSTPVALRRLKEAGLLRERQYQIFSRAYEFLRRLELRLRIVHDYATDHLPEGRPALAQLARRLGFHGEDPGVRLLTEYGRITGEAREAFEEIVA